MLCEWNCLSRVRQPVTKAGPSSGSAGFRLKRVPEGEGGREGVIKRGREGRLLTNTLVVGEFGELCDDKQETDDAEILHHRCRHIDLPNT